MFPLCSLDFCQKGKAQRGFAYGSCIFRDYPSPGAGAREKSNKMRKNQNQVWAYHCYGQLALTLLELSGELYEIHFTVVNMRGERRCLLSSSFYSTAWKVLAGSFVPSISWCAHVSSRFPEVPTSRCQSFRIRKQEVKWYSWGKMFSVKGRADMKWTSQSFRWISVSFTTTRCKMADSQPYLIVASAPIPFKYHHHCWATISPSTYTLF